MTPPLSPAKCVAPLFFLSFFAVPRLFLGGLLSAFGGKGRFIIRPLPPHMRIHSTTVYGVEWHRGQGSEIAPAAAAETDLVFIFILRETGQRRESVLPTSRGKGKKNSLAVGPLGSASPCLCLDKGRAGGVEGETLLAKPPFWSPQTKKRKEEEEERGQ